MSNVAKLKKKAAELEQKKQFDKALAVYIQILDEGEGTDDADVALYNRVGDLLLRQGSVGDAVTYYEKAVDLYAEGGFFNNAIALCNKILRQSPGRSSIYYKLGKISAKKGFTTDAKQNFLEYADRMQRAGQIDEAFRALKEFADLCPDQEDVRLMLAEQLAKKGRKGEAMEQLQALYERLDSEGRSTEARATIDRMKSIDPEAEPKATGAKQESKSKDLVFLDVTWDEPAQKRPMRATVPVRPPAEEPPRKGKPTDDLPLLDTGAPDEPAPRARKDLDAGDRDERAALDGLTKGSGFGGGAATSSGAGVLGLEPTNLGDSADDTVNASAGLLNLEPPLSGSEFASLRLETPADLRAVAAPAHDLALPGELPMLDVPGMPGAPESGEGGELEFILPDDSEPPRAPSGFGELEPPIARSSTASAGLQSIDLDVEHSPGGFIDGLSGDLPMLDVGGSFDADDAKDLSPHDAVQPAALDYMADALPDASAPSALPTIGDVSALVPPSERPQRDLASAAAAKLPPEAGIPPAVLDAAARGVTDDFGGLELLDDSTEPMRPLDESGEVAAVVPRRGSTSVLAQSVENLRARVGAHPDDWTMRRQLGEALLEAGQREAGLAELESTMIGFERRDDLESARSVAEEIIRVNPASVRHHQKCVEYAFRTSDKPRLVEAYLQLADALFRSGQPDKSRAVYQRVLELAPDDIRAHAAIAALGIDVPVTAPAKRDSSPGKVAPRRYTAEAKAALPEEAVRPARPTPTSDDDLVNLGDWLRDTEGPKSTRMVVEEKEPTGDEQADFNEMLRRFKQGVAENVEEEDHESHYDLGVAYKEMGLLDEAIAEFQKALRGANKRVRTYEALGQCFLEKQQFHIAATILQRALAEGLGDDQLVGVLYLLGYASEALQQWRDAVVYYQRVFAVDIQFRDVAQRLTTLERVAK
jgi:tetratricopeptide (TPR) repeat protein